MEKIEYNGFTVVEAIMVVAIIVLIGVVGWLVYKDYHKTSSNTVSATQAKSSNSAKSSSSSPTSTNPYAGWKTYTSNIGGFTLRYPNSWSLYGFRGTTPVAGSQLNGSETEVEIWEYPETASTNNFTVDISLSKSTNGLIYNLPTSVDNGTETKLSNGNNWYVWQTNASASQNPNCFEGSPTILLVSPDSYFNALPDGYYISYQGDFCGGQKQQTTYSFSQQVSSPEWQDGLNILKSIKT